jgi:hypothetical protein
LVGTTTVRRDAGDQQAPRTQGELLRGRGMTGAPLGVSDETGDTLLAGGLGNAGSDETDRIDVMSQPERGIEQLSVGRLLC